MAFAPHSLVAFGGTITSPSGNDIWQCGVRVLGTTGGGELSDNHAYMLDVFGPLAGWFSATSSGMRSDCTLDYVKVNGIDAAGHYSDPNNSNRHDYSPKVAGGVRGTWPAFTCLVFTWETGFDRGAGHRGRIYPPNSTYVLASGDEVDPNDAAAAATAGTTLLEVLRNRANEGRGGFPVVASTRGAVTRQITACSVDTIGDVQRRRKNAVPGVRRTHSWTP